MSEIPGSNAAHDILPLVAAKEDSKQRRWGLLLTGVVGGSLVALYSVAAPFIAPALRKHCLPFVPATPKQIENVLGALRGRKGSLVDLGSGDGRIVIAAAKVGFKAVGYDLNPWLVWYSRYRAWREGVHRDAKFYISDLWKISFSQYTNVVIFGVPGMGKNGLLLETYRIQRIPEHGGGFSGNSDLKLDNETSQEQHMVCPEGDRPCVRA
ncbi:ATP synthase subunit C lysine N-methyltransferase isoform X2 [Varanus komodoensis]|uniref:ATP synthase subunit C lysine N-methyltransferase isoform X2 n=1 Tax=Varanus komodoensis TaxID=61221 RepID=UPI001CF7A014|nr:ATP synthase subunit C lysine N-methyltransferase isoform X2 [Varanus komodoensis]